MITFEGDIGWTADQEIVLLNPDAFMWGGQGGGYGRGLTRLFLLGFGQVGTTWVAMWDDAQGLEGAMEEAAAYLAEHAPGHITSEEEISELMKEAAEEQGYTGDLSEADWEDPDFVKVYEAATADLTYTESGWLTSYEWTIREVDSDEPLYKQALDASIEYVDDEEGFDDDEWEIAQKMVASLPPVQAANPGTGTGKLKSKLLR